MPASTTDWITAFGTVAGAVALFVTAAVAMIIAIWGDALRRRAFKPRLDVQIETKAPYCQRTQLVRGVTVGPVTTASSMMPPEPNASDASGRQIYDCYYLRCAVVNTGNTVATNVGVRMLSLSRMNEASGQFDLDQTFRPFNLRWSHLREVYLPRLEPRAEMSRYCDLAHVFNEGERLLEFDTEVTPGPVGDGVWPTKKGPGLYLVLLAVTADDAYYVARSLTVEYRGGWRDAEEAMFAEVLRVSVHRNGAR